jgi:serine/threonine-protein kinase
VQVTFREIGVTSATRNLLAERYQLIERIATGGMGLVWRARDERLGRDVAIKLIRPEYADDPTFRQRLEQEARATAAIRNPHVVRLHDVCEEPHADGGCQSFIVMELVDGRPLSAVLRNGPLPIPLTITVLQQAASALAAAHARQIVHRDIKPANLMLDDAGRVTVLDFGIARAADAIALTATDLILGTARYISPEQANGKSAIAASDVYSLGIVAFECLSGAVPFDADSDVAIALAHVREPVPALAAEVPAPLAGLVEQMLAKTPSDRPSADEIEATLATISPTADTAPIALPELAADPGVTKPLKTLALPAVGRIWRQSYRDTRSAPLRAAIMFPAAALAALLLIAAAIAGGPNGAPHSAAAGLRGTTTNHAVAEQTQTAPTKVAVRPFRFLGEDWSVVRSRLRGLDLVPVARFAGHGPVETVVGLAPTGRVARGSRITIEVSRTGPPPPKPADHSGPPTPGHIPPGQKKKHGGPGPG